MASENFIIQIILDAQSKIAPVLNAAADEVEKLQVRVKAADSTLAGFGRRLDQVEAHVSKTRDTLRSLNPTLDATDRKFKGLSGTLTVVNRNMGVLERNSAKAAGALGGVAILVDRLERKLAHLDERMTEMGARRYEAEFKVDTTKSELKIRELERDLERATRGVYTAKTDVEIAAAMAKAEALRKELESIGRGDRATNIVIDVGLRNEAETKLKIDELNRKAEEATKRPRIFQFAAETRAAERDIGRLTAYAKAIDKQRIGIRASLQTGEFKAQYAEILAEMKLLGASRTQMKVVAKLDRNSVQEFGRQIQMLADRAGSTDLTPSYSQLLSGIIRFAIYGINPVITILGALGGAFLAVGSSALSAAGGIAGFASAGLAQAVPVIGLMIGALSRLQFVMKAVQAAQMQKDKSAYQDTTVSKQQASSADALKSAHQGVADAIRNLTYAQEALTQARKDGIRTLQDLVLAEERSKLSSLHSGQALASSIATGQGDILDLQLQQRTDTIGSRRATTDARRGVAGGIEGLPAVVQARRAVEDARRGVDRANEALAKAGTSADFAAGRIGAADRALAIALSHLDPAERRLYGVIKRFQDLFMPGGALTHVMDPITSAFATGLNDIIKLFTDPAVMQATEKLAGAIGGAITQAAHFFTTGPMRQALLFFTQEAAQNLPKVEKIFEGVVRIFDAIAKAASGGLGQLLDNVSSFFDGLAKNLESSSGQTKLAKFFDDALKSLQAFWDLFKAFGNLFAAIMGPGGGVDEGNRSIEGLAREINRAAGYVRGHSDAVHHFLDESITVMHELFKLVVAVGAAIVNVFNEGAATGFLKFLRNVVLPVFSDIVRAIGKIASILGDVATWGPATTFMHLAADVAAAWIIAINGIKAIGSIIKFFGTALKVVSGGIGGIKNLFAGARGLTPATPLFVEVVNQLPGTPPGEPVPGPTAPGESPAAGSALARVLRFATRAAPWVVAADALINADPAGQTPAQERRSLDHTRRAGRGQGFGGGQYGTLQGMSGRELSDAAKATTQELKNESAQLDVLNTQIDNLNKKGAPQWMLSPLEKQRDALTNSIRDWQNYSRQIDAILSGRVKQTLKETEGNFEGMRIETRAHLKDIMQATHDNMKTIADELGTKSYQGKEALAQNFKDAADQIKQSMDDGLISTTTGLQKIEDLLDARLQLYGFTKQEAHKFNQITNVEANRGHAEGGWAGRINGWVGNAGERGRDVVRTVLGRGEAVLNWAQQRAVNLAMTGRDTLGAIFKRTNSMHAGMDGPGYAAGGVVLSPGVDMREGSEPQILADLRKLSQRVGPITVISGYRTPQHSVEVGGFPNDPHTRGQAADLSAAFLTQRNADALLRSVGLYRPFYPAQAKEYNHVQLLGSGPSGGGAVGAVAAAAAQAVQYKALPHIQTVINGLLGSNVQGAVNLYRAALEKVNRRGYDHQFPTATAASATDQGGSGATGPDANALPGVPRKLRPYDHRYPMHHTGTPGLVLPPSVVAAIQHWAGLPLPAYISQRESTNMPGIVEWPPESDGAQGYGLWQLTTKHVDAPIVRLIQRLGGWMEMLNPLKNAFVSAALYRLGGPGRWSTYGHAAGGLVGKALEWGGFQAQGGDYIVNKPTAFIAGDNGPERATFMPMAKGWPGLSKDPGYFANSPAVQDVGVTLAGESASTSLTTSSAAVRAIIRRLAGIPTKTKDAVNLLAASMASLGDTTNNVITNMMSAVDSGVARAKSAIQRRIFGSGTRRNQITDIATGPGDIMRAHQVGFATSQAIGSVAAPGLHTAVAAVIGQGTADIGVLSQQRTGYQEAQSKNNELMAQAQRGLAAAQRSHNKKAEEVFKNRIQVFKANSEKISESLSQNAEDMVVRREQMQNDIFTATNNFFDRQNTATQRMQRIANALGKSGDNQGIFQKQIDDAAAQVKALVGQSAAATASGNTDLANQINDKIADLQTSIVELTAQKLQDSIDQVNSTAQKKLAAVGLGNRLADVQQKAGDAVGASISRGNLLQQTGNILSQQRNDLYGLLATAQSEGNTGQVDALTAQIDELSTQIAENTQAISDNTVETRQTRIDQITHTGQFQGGIFSGLIGIVQLLGQISGSVDTGAIRGLLNQQGSNLANTGSGLADQLFQGYGIDARGLSGMSLVNFLANLDYKGIEANFTQAQKDQFENLINAIIENASAIAQNTDQLNQLNGNNEQSFSSTAWQLVRTAIFNGSGGLLPQYSIPQMHVGGLVTKAGVFDLQVGERVITPSQQQDMGNYHEGDTIVQVTSPTEVLDPGYVAEVLHFKRGSRRAS